MKKIFFSMVLMVTSCLTMMAEVDRTFIFTDADGNEVTDGSTWVVNTINEDGFGELLMPVGLFIKNISGNDAGGKMTLDLTQMPYGSLSCCSFGTCRNFAMPGNVDSSRGTIAAGETQDMETEWFPGEEKKDGAWEAIFQLCVLETDTNQWGATTYGDVIAYGPKITVKFVIGDDPTPLKGDINGDEIVNVTDVTALINTILGTADYDLALCDVNGDGVMNVTDVTTLINLILGD